MSIRRLRISQLRNILDAELDPARINLICGPNGSGKTSALEAVFLLGSGRSFRATRLEPVINHGASQCTVFASIEAKGGGAPVAMGLSRHRDGGFEGRIQGQAVRSSADLARKLPIQLINSSTFDLLEGGPRVRRQFLDWGVFHVEQGFHQLWIDVHRCLRQRNSLLRHARIPADQLQAWSLRLAAAATQLDLLRHRYFEAFLPVFRRTLGELTDIEGLELGYLRGWDKGRELFQVLDDQFERDRDRGFTQAGPHRADLRVRVRGLSADEVLSRGQQKLVVCAMKLAQGRVFAAANGQDCVFLVDDLPSELDRRHRRVLCQLLGALECQVFVSCVDATDLDGCWEGLPGGVTKVFHVEQGRFATPD
ncbi:MAG: DNA replication/repair protein RecF [Gammaproteobacteria bacterium]|nr:DNA replication/repair protein RecF [Gammaproteobacteria bacterium]